MGIDVTSNDSLVTVGDDPTADNAGVAIGPFTSPFADHGTALDLDSSDHPEITTPLTSAATTDETHAADCYAGQVIVFPLTVKNPNIVLPDGATNKKGDGGPATFPDIYNISVVCATAGREDDFSVLLYKADGITPLADTNKDGKPDTGALDPDAQTNIVVKVFIKADAEYTDATKFTVTAKSVRGAASDLKDTTDLYIDVVHPAGVDIATKGELAKGDNKFEEDATATDDARNDTVKPGDVLTFPIDIGNMRPRNLDGTGSDHKTGVADTYNLSFVKLKNTDPDVPAEAKDAAPFVVQLFKDDGNGVIDAHELVPISDTSWMKAIADVGAPYADLARIFRLNVRVQVPPGTAAGTYYIDVKATSNNNPAKFDKMRLRITVLDVPAIEITPDNTATVVPGGSYIFSHVVTNTGNQKYNFKLSHSPLDDGYSAVWVKCTDGSVIGTGTPSTYTTTVELEPGASEPVCLKVFVPANVASGSVKPITVTSETVAPVALVSDTAVDIITVIAGALQLTKENIPPVTDPPVAPGGTISYTTTYKNLSAGDLTEIWIADAIPAHTTLAGTNVNDIKAKLPDGSTITAGGNVKFQYSDDGGTSWDTIPSPFPAIGTVTNIRVNIGPVKAGESGNFEFKVKVK